MRRSCAGAATARSTDPLAAEVGAFFARLKVPIDFVPGAEALIAKAAPAALYCAFIQFVRERLARGPRPARRQPLAGGLELAREPAHGSGRGRTLEGRRGAAPAARGHGGDRPRVARGRSPVTASVDADAGAVAQDGLTDGERARQARPGSGLGDGACGDCAG